MTLGALWAELEERTGIRKPTWFVLIYFVLQFLVPVALAYGFAGRFRRLVAAHRVVKASGSRRCPGCDFAWQPTDLVCPECRLRRLPRAPEEAPKPKPAAPTPDPPPATNSTYEHTRRVRRRTLRVQIESLTYLAWSTIAATSFMITLFVRNIIELFGIEITLPDSVDRPLTAAAVRGFLVIFFLIGPLALVVPLRRWFTQLVVARWLVRRTGDERCPACRFEWAINDARCPECGLRRRPGSSLARMAETIKIGGIRG